MKRMNLLAEIASGLGEWLRELAARPRYLIYAVLVHIAFFTVLVMSFEWTPTPVGSAAPEVDIIEAVVIDETRIRAEQERLKQAEARKTAEEARKRDQLRKAEEARVREEQRLVQLKKEQEAARKAAEVAEKQAAEAKKQAEVAKKQVEAARKAEDARRAEDARKAEEARKAAETARKAADAKRAEEAARQAAATRERAAREQSEVDKYVVIIKQKVERNWIKPVQWQGLRCRVRVNLIPGGDVIDVKIVAGSGDALFDSSVEAAVRKASPLPVPSASDPLFDRFRELEFVFNPQG
ncbi:MAG: cell envelope integrity protein TolA [Gammaproteobacteria bacterium]|nr:cell envelope integrity protein TolA [Gammaproteobacteria bacterium]